MKIEKSREKKITGTGDVRPAGVGPFGDHAVGRPGPALPKSLVRPHLARDCGGERAAEILLGEGADKCLQNNGMWAVGGGGGGIC